LHSDSTTQAAAKWSAQFQPHHTARLDKTGHCRLMVAPVPEGESPEFAALRAGARLVKQLARDAPGRSIGVLVRKNSQGQIARLIHQIGQDEPGLPGVRASQEGGNPLIDSPAVRMALSAIRLADHPGDDPARYHVAHSPLGESLRLADHADDAASLAAASRIRAMLLEEGYGPTLRRWAAALAPRCDAHDLSRLMQLVELGYEYDADATLRPADFVDFVESRKVEDPTSSQVRVMTIHASKGLQFDAVVLPQLSAVPLIGRPPVVCQLKDPKTREVRQVTRWMNKDVLQCMPELRDRQSEHERQVIRESYCALYVALTRAAEALYMIVEPDRPGQRIQTFGKLLIEALGDGRPAEQGTTLYDNGQEDWWAPRRDVSTPDDPRWTELPTPKLAESPRRTRMLPRWSPSQAERQGKVDLALRLRLGGAGSRRRGTMMHAMLECVRWLDDAPPGRAELLAALRRAGGEGEEAALIEEFDRTLRQPSIAAALSRAAYPADARLELAIEEPFVLREQDAILSGKIDRLVRVHREGRLVGAEVIDYKTDAIGEGGAEAIVEEYRPQIQAYRQAVARMHGLPVQNVTAKLLLIEAGLAVEI
jgi:ATP-dependent exoDNAse (exonuclease V) beta subunit